ncbi:universal stress protein [Kytococcus sedentarius]|uniref:universal stress protein n=1 Tax=Kytococcus sedentarius TaxID=1276 RepID=UPI0035BBED2C
MGPVSSLLFVLDAAPGHHVAREYVVDLAVHRGATVHLLYVALESTRTTPMAVNPDQRRRRAEEARAAMADEVTRLDELGVTEVQTHLRAGDTASHVLGLADELGVDLIIIGDQADSRLLRALIGERPATRLARRSPCSVLVAKEGIR